MDVLVMIAQFLVGLTLLVGLHEWGHFYAARLFNIRVSKFYIFFDFLFPLPHVLNFSLFKWKKGETEYGLGWFPFGGYVKIEGMMDESMDKEALKRPPEPWEFRSKPAWQRLIVMLGGIIVNTVTGILIFIGLMWYGESYVPVENAVNGIQAGALAQEIGLRDGDKIIGVNGQDIEEFNEVTSSAVFLDDSSFYTVLRGSEKIRIYIPSDFLGKLSNMEKGDYFISLRHRFHVGKIESGSAADQAGLQKGDSIIQLGEHQVKYFERFHELKKDMAGQATSLVIVRDGQKMTLETTIPEDGILGFRPELQDLTKRRHLSFPEAVTAGTGRAFSIVIDNVKGLLKIAKGDVNASDALSGPIAIGGIFGSTFDFYHFFFVCGLLSMVLAFMNLLPIPALDGGHLLFLLYEMIAGRKPPEKFMEVSQMVGMMLLLALMAFTIGNDIYKAL